MFAISVMYAYTLFIHDFDNDLRQETAFLLTLICRIDD